MAASIFFNDTASTEIYTLSLHDALPISRPACASFTSALRRRLPVATPSTVSSRAASASSSARAPGGDRKSTRLNSSHANLSYAVFCLQTKRPSAHHRQRALLGLRSAHHT